MQTVVLYHLNWLGSDIHSRVISTGTVLIIDYWWIGAGILNGDPLQALVNNAAISLKDAVERRLGCGVPDPSQCPCSRRSSRVDIDTDTAY